MSGRLLTGVITDIASWRIAILAIGCCALAAAVMFAKILPASRHFRPVPLKPKALFINFRLHFRDKGLPLLFIIGFLVMGAFVTLFNYIGYRLLHAPYSMSQATVGLISVVYLAGSWSSPKAGAMSARFGRGPVFLSCVGLMLTGVLLTLFASVWLILPGLLMFTGGSLPRTPLPAAG
ncbi:Inner membrane transport protein ynfM [Tatumella ptyseos]|uniref:Inner membrane transport protein ynfM n=1 Tax=Tatumella ptyseos TaxID=82987 RepID=A0A2X5R8P3_9GAMM|nr:Inner membrane transport protein ynfM [Tatumella ptyseos]